MREIEAVMMLGYRGFYELTPAEQGDLLGWWAARSRSDKRWFR